MKFYYCSNIAVIINKIKARIVEPVDNFKNFEIHSYFILLACLPTARPTSSRRIGPNFSHNTEY